MAKLIKAIIKVEGGKEAEKYFTSDIIKAGIELADVM